MVPDSHARSGDIDGLATAIGLYALGEITLGESAQRVGISKQEMKAILQNSGVSLRMGPENRDDLLDEIDVAQQIE